MQIFHNHNSSDFGSRPTQFGNTDINQTQLTRASPNYVSWRLTSPSQLKKMSQEQLPHFCVQKQRNSTCYTFDGDIFGIFCTRSWAHDGAERDLMSPAALHGLPVLLLWLGSLVPSLLGGFWLDGRLAGRFKAPNLMDSHHSSGLTLKWSEVTKFFTVSS